MAPKAGGKRANQRGRNAVARPAPQKPKSSLPWRAAGVAVVAVLAALAWARWGGPPARAAAPRAQQRQVPQQQPQRPPQRPPLEQQPNPAQGVQHLQNQLGAPPAAPAALSPAPAPAPTSHLPAALQPA
jgi:hypothetical protein